MSKWSNQGELLVQSLWEQQMCPIVNGIVFGDGKIVELDKEKSGGKQELFRVVNITDIKSFVDERGDYWTAITQLCEFELPQRNLIVRGGEGGFGGDGFVALSRISDSDLIWIAFFDYANPFIEVSMKGDLVVATSTLEYIWQFPIAEPYNGMLIKK